MACRTRSRTLFSSTDPGLVACSSSPKTSFPILSQTFLYRRFTASAETGGIYLGTLAAGTGNPIPEQQAPKRLSADVSSLVFAPSLDGPPNGTDRPPKELVEIAFGNKKFEPSAGLYFLGRIGDDLHLTERVRYVGWVAKANNSEYVTAGQFLFYNCSFVLNLDPSKSLPQQIQTEHGVLNTLYRPYGFDIKLNAEASQRITFRW